MAHKEKRRDVSPEKGTDIIRGGREGRRCGNLSGTDPSSLA